VPIALYIVASTLDLVFEPSCQVFRRSSGNMRTRIPTKDGARATQSRLWKTLLTLLVSMTSGALILILLGDRPPSAGAFSLSVYYQLGPMAEVIESDVEPVMGRWNRIEICYSGTRGLDAEWLASLQGLRMGPDLEYHFVVCNELGAEDGQILATPRWENQQAVRSVQTGYPSEGTIRICLVAEGRSGHTTDLQFKRVESLVETLTQRFGINEQSVSYSGGRAVTRAL